MRKLFHVTSVGVNGKSLSSGADLLVASSVEEAVGAHVLLACKSRPDWKIQPTSIRCEELSTEALKEMIAGVEASL